MAQSHRSLRNLAAVLTAALLLPACPVPSQRAQPPSGPSPQPQSPGAGPAVPSPQPTPPPPSRPPPPTRENHLSPATLSLVTQARTLISHGYLDGASSTLDRSLRIEPNNPLVWTELGRLRVGEKHGQQ